MNSADHVERARQAKRLEVIEIGQQMGLADDAEIGPAWEKVAA